MKSADEETLASGRWREGKRPLAVGRDLGLHEGGGEEASVVAVDDAAFYIQLPSLHSLQKIWVSSWREALRMIPRESLIGSMERQISHRHASSSGSSGIHALTMKNNKPESKLLPHPLPNSSCLQRDLMSMSFPDLLKVAKQLKHAGVVTTLRLFVSLNEQHIVNQRFSSLDPRTTDAVFEFTRF